MPPAVSPLHDRNPECIEALATLDAEVREFRSWQDRQNGSLVRMAESLSGMRVDMTRMSEQLSVLIARQAEDRQRVDHMAAVPAPSSGPQPAVPDTKERPRWWYLLVGAALAAGGAGVKELLGLIK